MWLRSDSNQHRCYWVDGQQGNECIDIIYEGKKNPNYKRILGNSKYEHLCEHESIDDFSRISL